MVFVFYTMKNRREQGMPGNRTSNHLQTLLSTYYVLVMVLDPGDIRMGQPGETTVLFVAHHTIL